MRGSRFRKYIRSIEATERYAAAENIKKRAKNALVPHPTQMNHVASLSKLGTGMAFVRFGCHHLALCGVDERLTFPLEVRFSLSMQVDRAAPLSEAATWPYEPLSLGIGVRAAQAPGAADHSGSPARLSLVLDHRPSTRGTH